MVQWLNAISHVSEMFLNGNIQSLTHTSFTRCGSAVVNKVNSNIIANRAKQQNRTEQSRAKQVTSGQNREGRER